MKTTPHRTPPWRRAAWGLVTWLLLSASGLAASSEEFLVRNWTTVDGVPHNTVRALVESRKGYLWMGTANGLARFDGVRFTTFNVANTPDLLSDDIFELHEDRQGDLWMRTRRGVARRHQGRFEFLTPRPGGFLLDFMYFAEDAAGQMWFLGQAGLARWDGARLIAVPLPAIGAIPPRHFCAAPDGGLWFTDDRGLWRFREGNVEFIPVSPAPEVIAAGRDGKVWGLSYQQGLFELAGRQWSRVSALEGEPCGTLYLTADGDVWVGSSSRAVAFRFRNGVATRVGGEAGLEGNRAVAFMQDAERNVWLGANAGGLFRLRERRVRIFGRNDGLEGLNTSSIVAADDGALMVNVMGQTLNRFASDRFEPIRLNDFYFPTALARAASGGVWAGTFRDDLRRVVNGREVERIGSNAGTRALFTDREGRLWRGTRTAGIERFAGTNLTTFSTNQGLSHPNVYCFAQDRDGAVWAGTENGLNRIANDTVTRFGTGDGLGHMFISALCVDSRGTLWAGTLGGGLSAWNGRRFVTLTTREGLPSNTIEQLLEDDLGNLWLGTRVGLVRVPLPQLHDCLAGGMRRITGTLLGRDEGLVRPNFWTEYQPASLKSADGRLWFCTGSGLVSVDPRRFATPARPPLVHIEELSVDGRVQTPPSGNVTGAVLAPGGRRVEIHYTGISPSEPELVRFRHRLVGYDPDWVEAGQSRVANYAKLPPGDYTFEVTAANNDGVWSDQPATLALTVQPAFWQAWWFRLALTLLGVGLVLAAHRWRLARVERRRAEQEDFSRRLIDSQERERKRIAAELHDSLGQNLLVIKNRAALALTLQGNPEKMTAQVQEVSSMASAAVREVRVIAQNLRPFQIDELGLTKSIRSLARTISDTSGISITGEQDEIDHILPPEFEINLYRVVQECLSNLAKHSQARSATLTLRRTDDAIRFELTDTGRGFTLDATGSASATGFGLRNIAERVRTMGGEVEVQSTPGAGTHIQVCIPVHTSAFAPQPPRKIS